MKSPVQDYVEQAFDYPWTKKDTLNLLLYIAQFDRFMPLPETKDAVIAKVNAWHEMLPKGDPNYARAAVRNWYAKDMARKGITPAEIIGGMFELHTEYDRILEPFIKEHGGQWRHRPAGGEEIVLTDTFMDTDMKYAKLWAYEAVLQGKDIHTVEDEWYKEHPWTIRDAYLKKYLERRETREQHADTAV